MLLPYALLAAVVLYFALGAYTLWHAAHYNQLDLLEAALFGGNVLGE